MNSTRRIDSLGAVITATILVFLAMVAFGWVGYLGSDDGIYAVGAYGWLEHVPYVGGHGSIRYTITIPIALSFLTLGANEVSMAVPVMLYGCGILALLVYATYRALGPTAAWMTAAILALQPILVIWSSMADIDIVEAFFIFASVTCFYLAVVSGPTWRRLLLAGAFMGGAFLSRETAVFGILLYGVLFLAGYGFPRVRYFIMALGFLAVWGLELLYLGVMTGDPLYRVNIALHHDSSIDRTIDLVGNVIVHPAIDPVLVLLFNQEFGLLFWIAVPCGIWLAVKKDLSGPARQLLIVYGGMALVWFFAVAGAQSLLPLNPRYFLVSALGASVVLGVAMFTLFQSGKRRTAIALMVLVIGANFAGIYVENRNHAFGEHALAELATQYDEPLYTDPDTLNRGEFLLVWNHAEDHVYSSAPPPGGLYVYNSLRADKPNRLMTKSELPLYQPKADWRLVEVVKPDSKLAGKVIRALGWDKRVPARVMNALSEGHPGVRIYRVPAAGG